MMQANKALQTVALTIISATIFAAMFYKRDWGLNLFLMQMFWLCSLLFINRGKKSLIQKILGISNLATAVFALIHHTTNSWIIGMFSLFLFAVSLHQNKLLAMHEMFIAWVWNSAISYFRVPAAFRLLLETKLKSGKKIQRWLMFLVPIVVLFLFAVLYAIGNPTFGSMFTEVQSWFSDIISSMVKHINFIMLFVFVGGLMISIPIYFVSEVEFYGRHFNFQENMLRARRNVKMSTFKLNGLDLERKLGEFLLYGLNAMLILLLIFEAKDVWFGFNWQGEYLKEFVHEGMNVLLIAILISIALALYLFRRNMNFYGKSKRLKQLTYLWLGLNAVLALSVAIRDFYYVFYFALAYKRIALLFFIAAVLVGLYSVYIKIKLQKNTRFLLKINSLSIYFLLVFSTFFNWDKIIAQYNFSNADRAFVHLDYLATLNNSTLPILANSGIDLSQIEVEQRNRIGESFDSYSDKYISAQNYQQLVTHRADAFKARWENSSWLEWNFAEWFAYQQLSEREVLP